MTTTHSRQRSSSATAFLRSLSLYELTCGDHLTVLARLLARLASHFGACDAFILELSDKGELTVLASLPDTPLTASEPLVRSVAEAGTSRLITDAMNSPDFPGDPAFQTFNMSWAFCAPLKTGLDRQHFLYLDGRKARSWRPVDTDVLDIVAAVTGLAMLNAEMQLRLKNDERLITAGTAALHCSHSLKNLLQLIGGAAEVIDLALKRHEMPRVLRSWAIMQPNLHRLRRLTLDMLYYSKERPLELAQCELNAIAANAARSLAMQVREKNIRLRTRLDKAVGPLELDGGRIHELVTNLILNAADAVGEKDGLITISTKLDHRTNKVRLSVSNNGPQMTPEQIAGAFVPFNSTKQRFGTGLGLAIAKRIADQHGATISIKSTPRATTFTLLLPVAKAAESQI
jgi:signal transduction histidine kinase